MAASCCNPRGCDEFFSPRFARRAARRYRKRGLDETARRMVEFLEARGIVCCYPDYDRLLTAAAEHARRLLVFSYPRRNAVSRVVVRVQNLVFGLLRKEFRTFTHPPAKMLAVLERRGFRASFAHRGLVWQVAGLER
jgi:hypothetical protein